jgi:ABC-type sugar transport system permease subunit
MMTGTRRQLGPYLFVAPFLVSFLVFYVYPIISGINLSLTDQLGFGQANYVGVANYLRVFSDQRFWKSITNVALLFTFGSLSSIVTLAIVMAHVINAPEIGRLRRSFTTILFAPNVTSVIVIGIIFSFLLKTNGGAINEFLGLFGAEPIQWLRDPDWAIPSLIILVVWRYLGVNTLYVLAGLQAIPTSLYEAADIEGARGIQKFFRITLPLLGPIMEFIVFQAAIGTFAVFGEPFVLVGGAGTQNSMLFPTYYLYDTSINRMRFGYAAAMAFVLAAIILVITVIQRRLFRSSEE